MSNIKLEDLVKINAYEVLLSMEETQASGTYMNFNLELDEETVIPVMIAVAINESAHDLLNYIQNYDPTFEDEDPPRLTLAEEGDLKRIILQSEVIDTEEIC